MSGGTKSRAKHNKPRKAAVLSVGFCRPHRLKKKKKKKKNFFFSASLSGFQDS
jgi:hypothetical protein